ncbi:MAG: SpoIIE family protein phosphatase [Nocardioides sp.]
MADRDPPPRAGWRPDAQLLAGLTIGAVVVDPRGQVLDCNDAAASRLGRDVASCLGDNIVGLLFPEPSGDTIAEILARVLSGETWTGLVDMLGVGGLARPAHSSWSPAWTQAQVTGAVILLDSASAQGGWRDAGVASRLQRLAAVTTDLLAADTVDGVADVVVHHLADAAGATIASVSLLVDEHTLALAGLRGGRPGASADWATFPVADATPAGDALRAGHPLLISGREDFLARYPDVEMATDGERALLCLPLQVAGRSIGVVTLSFPGVRDFDPAELEFFRVLADTCAQSVERIRARDDVADREAKLQFLADASVELASSLDYAVTLKAVAHLAVPHFADWCVIQLVQDGVLRPLAMAHPDGVLASRVRDLQEKYPPDPDARRGAYQVLRSGVSELTPDITDDMLVAAAHDDGHLQVLRDLSFRSALTVPLVVRDEVLGVVTWVTGEQGRRFGPEDLAFGEDLARRAAVAIDNSVLHSQIRDVAIRLQRAVLPDAVPEMPGWEVAVRYLPAGRTEVGGDFYDVVPLADDRVVVFVGDVMGRGVGAASAMAQMRSAIRTLIAVDPEPGFVMTSLDKLFAQYDLQRLVTVAYGIADPVREELHVVNAGHLPPLVVHADETSSEVATDETLLLGAGGGSRTVLTVPFVAGDTLLMFSDGLVERREESLDEGQRRLRDRVATLNGEDLSASLGRLVDEVRDDGRDDDVAAVALRLSR